MKNSPSRSVWEDLRVMGWHTGRAVRHLHARTEDQVSCADKRHGRESQGYGGAGIAEKSNGLHGTRYGSLKEAVV